MLVIIRYNISLTIKHSNFVKVIIKIFQALFKFYFRKQNTCIVYQPRLDNLTLF